MNHQGPRDEVDEVLEDLKARDDTPADLVNQIQRDWREMKTIMFRMVSTMKLIRRHRDTDEFVEAEKFKRIIKATIDEL